MPRDKWRPSLGLVVLGVLGIVAALPLFGLFLIRVYENGPIREAEAELIAQSAALAAVMARTIEALPDHEGLLGTVAPPRQKRWTTGTGRSSRASTSRWPTSSIAARRDRTGHPA